MAIDKITTPAVTDDSVTLAKMAPGTDGNIISYDASGNPVAVATGSAGQVLTSAGAGAPPTFAGAGTNTPGFLAYLSSGQTVPNQTTTTLVFQTEVYDSASAYNTSNGIFTVPSGQGGRYFFTYGIRSSNWNTTELTGQLKDGSSNDYLVMEDGDAQGDNNTLTASGIVSLSAGDTIFVQWYQNGGGGTSPKTGQKNTWFGGFKLIE